MLSEFSAQMPEHLGGGIFVVKNLDKINLLFGKNGSGKSVFLRNFASADQNTRHYVNPEKAGQFQYNNKVFEQELKSQRFSNRNANINVNYYEQVVTRIQAFFTKRGAWEDVREAPVTPRDLERTLRLLMPEKSIRILTDQPYFQVE